MADMQQEGRSPMNVCAVQGCGRDVFAREWCQKHYTRWLRHGDPTETAHRRADDGWTPLRRCLDSMDASGICWLYEGYLNPAGYGMLTVDGTAELVHRIVYEELVGPIPEENEDGDRLTLDHLCRVRRCANPDHLEVVTERENTLRGMSPAAKAVRTGRCCRGHDLYEHGYERPDGRGRECKECHRIRSGGPQEASSRGGPLS